MSHWTVCKLKIRNPDRGVLKRVMEVLAKELGVGVVEENFVVTGWRSKRRCLFAIPMKLRYGNGYGVYIDSEGYLRVVVDDHGAPLDANSFAAKLNQYYTALALATAAQQLGFQVNVNQVEQGVIIDLVR